jgi:hypothetical protein
VVVGRVVLVVELLVVVVGAVVLVVELLVVVVGAVVLAVELLVVELLVVVVGAVVLVVELLVVVLEEVPPTVGKVVLVVVVVVVVEAVVVELQVELCGDRHGCAGDDRCELESLPSVELAWAVTAPKKARNSTIVVKGVSVRLSVRRTGARLGIESRLIGEVDTTMLLLLRNLTKLWIVSVMHHSRQSPVSRHCQHVLGVPAEATTEPSLPVQRNVHTYNNKKR